MTFNEWMESMMDKLEWWHISFIKASMFFFALMVAKLWPNTLGLEWYWYLALCIVFALVPWSRMFSK